MKELYYVFGISQSVDSLFNDVTLICESGLCALVEKVSSEDFGSEHIGANIRNTEWVKSKVIHHQEVLDAFATNSAVIPFKFGSVFESENSISAMLKSRSEGFGKILHKLEGKQEWGLKVFCDNEVLEKWIDTSHQEMIRYNDQIQEASAGKAFIIKRKKEEQIKILLKQELNDSRRTIYKSIEETGVEVLKNDELDPGLSKEKGLNVLNLAILGSDDQIRSVEQFVNTKHHEFLLKGIKLDLSGPWPAYNFAEL